jgi:hypothetical protein
VPASRQPSGVAASEAMGPRPPSKRSTTCGHRQGVRVGDEGGGQQQHEERFLPLLLRADAGLAARMAAKEAARVPGRTPPHSRPPPAASASSEARPSRWCRPPAAGGRRGWGTGRPAARACLQRVSGACGCGCGCGVGKGGGERRRKWGRKSCRPALPPAPLRRLLPAASTQAGQPPTRHSRPALRSARRRLPALRPRYKGGRTCGGQAPPVDGVQVQGQVGVGVGHQRSCRRGNTDRNRAREEPGKRVLRELRTEGRRHGRVQLKSRLSRGTRAAAQPTGSGGAARAHPAAGTGRAARGARRAAAPGCAGAARCAGCAGGGFRRRRRWPPDPARGWEGWREEREQVIQQSNVG